MPDAKSPLIEVCVEGIDGLVAGQEGGADRIELCASLLEGGIIRENIAGMRDASAAPELHFAALRDKASAMAWRNPNVGMGGTENEREYRNTATDPEAIAATIAAARN